MSEPLSLEQVRHVARLARLALRDAELTQFAAQLSSVLDYVRQLQALDVEGVAPMAHPGDLVNRLDDDIVEPSLDPAAVLEMAPASEAGYLSVPKVLPGEEP